MRDSQLETDMNIVTNRQAVFKKYGLTQAEWDSSFNYYCRHADVLYDIYQNVIDRMQNELVASGGDLASVGDMALDGDTSNVWRQEPNFVMMHLVPYNVRTFSLEADSTYKPGDKLIMDFDVQFIFEDGLRDFVTVLAMTLDNDSVVAQTIHSAQDGKVSLTVSDSQYKGIKSVRGYMMVTESINDEKPTSLRVLSVRNVRLIRMHVDKAIVDEKLRKDSVEQARRDSLRDVEDKPVEDQDQQTILTDDNEKNTIRRLAVPADLPVRARKN